MARKVADSGQKSLAQLLRAARERADLSQEELAERAGIARLTVTRLESDARTGAHADTLTRLAEALGIGLEDLVPSGEAKTVPIEEYLLSPWVAVDRPTPEEVEQLRGIPGGFWSSVTPTPEHVHEVLVLIRKSPKPSAK